MEIKLDFESLSLDELEQALAEAAVCPACFLPGCISGLTGSGCSYDYLIP